MLFKYVFRTTKINRIFYKYNFQIYFLIIRKWKLYQCLYVLKMLCCLKDFIILRLSVLISLKTEFTRINSFTESDSNEYSIVRVTNEDIELYVLSGQCDLISRCLLAISNMTNKCSFYHNIAL